jgi:hypothetical protein
LKILEKISPKIPMVRDAKKAVIIVDSEGKIE